MFRRLSSLFLGVRLALVAPAMLPALVACTGPSHGEATEYETTGVVRAIDTANHTVTIQHEDVPGYMPAMTMPFEVRDLATLNGIAVGDRVSFRFAAEPGGHHVVRSLRKQ